MKKKIQGLFPKVFNILKVIYRFPFYYYRKNINKNYRLNSDKRRKNPDDLNLWERKFYSQNGEDGIILEIFNRIGTTNKYYVEFGVEDGKECNTRFLREKHKWKGLLMDGSNENININLQKEFITAENIENLFKKHKVPNKFDLLSIDIDGNDYYVWEAIKSFSPRVVVIEYNSKFGPDKSLSIKYDPKHRWDGSDYMGASLLALKSLGKKKGYELVCCDNTGTNAFFIRDDLLKNWNLKKHEEIFRKPKYGTIFRQGHPKSKKKPIKI